MTDDLQRVIGMLEGKLDGMMRIIANTQVEIKGLREDFMNMEKGRLSALEVRFATLATEVAYEAKTSAMYTGIVASIVSAVIAGVILYLLKAQ